VENQLRTELSGIFYILCKKFVVNLQNFDILGSVPKSVHETIRKMNETFENECMDLRVENEKLKVIIYARLNHV